MNIQIVDWGTIEYPEALERQKELHAQIVSGTADTLILCEHPSVLTLGRSFHEDNLFFSREELKTQGYRLEAVDRGGDVTLHAPGQLVIYPILDLRKRGQDIRAYLQKLEQVAVDFLKGFDIVAHGDDDRRGVWVHKTKIASIGIGVSKWVTYHGMALNVNTDLELFKVIRPCGLDVKMTSMTRELGHPVDMAEAKRRLAKQFINIFAL